MYNPFTGYRLTQGFHRLHKAHDYGMDVGTPLPACSSGWVVYEWFLAAGYTATIYRSDGSWTRYCHGQNHGFPASHHIRQGEWVQMRSGNSGLSTGPHLHVFDTASDGKRMPPFTTGFALAGDGEPIFIDLEEEAMSKPQGIYAVVDGVPSWAWINWATGKVFSVHTQADADHVSGYMGSVEILTNSATATAGENYKALIAMAQGPLAPTSESGGVSFDPSSILDAIAEVPAKTRAEIIRD